jgi:Domain of unknown function (DUF5666)
MTMDPAPTVPSAPPNPIVNPTRRTSRVLDIALAVAAVLAIGGVAFAAGRLTAPASAGPAFARGLAPDGTVVTPDGSFDPNGPKPGGLASNGGLAIDGEVTAIDADSITLKLADGQEMTFKLDAATTYHEAADASSSDVAVGDDVSVKVTGGRVVSSNGGSSGQTPDMSARDVTVSR